MLTDLSVYCMYMLSGPLSQGASFQVELPYLFGYKTGFSLLRMTKNN